MTSRAEELLKEILTLPVEDRADVAAELLASLDEGAIDDPTVVQAAWARELEWRARRALSGESKASQWSDVRDAIARDLEQE